MWNNVNSGLRLARSAALAGTISLAASLIQAQERPASFQVDGRVALHSLMSLSDAHLQKRRTSRIIATIDDVPATDAHPAPLAEAARVNVPATFCSRCLTGSTGP
jgi:hypothetical protein